MRIIQIRNYKAVIFFARETFGNDSNGLDINMTLQTKLVREIH